MSTKTQAKIFNGYPTFAQTIHLSIPGSKIARQTLLLFGSQLILVGIGFGIKTVQTRWLGPEAYGLYAFFASFTGFAVLFFRLGFYSSLQVVLAHNTNPERESNLLGTGFLIALSSGIFFSLFILISSLFIDEGFDVQGLGHIMFVVAPLSFIIPFRMMISAMAVGSNKVHLIATFDLFAKGLFLAVLLLLALPSFLSLTLVIVFNLITQIFAGLLAFFLFRPKFRNQKILFRILLKKTKKFGFNFYVGTTANQATFKIDELLITYFYTATLNGFYSLAILLCSPMVMASQALSNSLFKRFSKSRRIQNKVLTYNLLWLVSSLFALILLADEAVFFLFGEDFMDVANYIPLLGVAFLLQGLYQPFSFLTAKSQGKAIRNVALTEAFINLTGNLILIPIYGVSGAIYTSIAAKGIHLLGKIYYYRKYLSSAHG